VEESTARSRVPCRNRWPLRCLSSSLTAQDFPSVESSPELSSLSCRLQPHKCTRTFHITTLFIPRQIQSCCRYRTLAQLLHLPPSIDVVFFGGEGAHLPLLALHVTLSEFADAGYVVMMSDSAAAHPHRVAAHIESLGTSSCSPALSFRPHLLSSEILSDPIFTGNNQSSLSSAAFSSLDDGFMITRSAAEDVLAERRRWIQVDLVYRACDSLKF
jgi:hypothetical protein